MIRSRVEENAREQAAGWRARTRRAAEWIVGGDLFARERELIDQLEAQQRRSEDIRQRLTLIQAERQNLGEDPQDLAAFEARVDELQADAERANAEDDPQPVLDELRDVRSAMRKRVVRIVQAGLAVEVLTAVLGPVLTAETVKQAQAVHLDYYTAIATIAPLLLVTGFVELALLRPSGGVWALLAFAVPPIVSTFAALRILAYHHPTPATDYLASWGLTSAFIALVVYFGLHMIDPGRG